MKKIIIVLLAAAGIISYLLNRKRTPVKTEAVEKTHHLTKVFSKAKQHAINS